MFTRCAFSYISSFSADTPAGIRHPDWCTSFQLPHGHVSPPPLRYFDMLFRHYLLPAPSHISGNTLKQRPLRTRIRPPLLLSDHIGHALSEGPGYTRLCVCHLSSMGGSGTQRRSCSGLEWFREAVKGRGASLIILQCLVVISFAMPNTIIAPLPLCLADTKEQR